jgi:hypothetical protein
MMPLTLESMLILKSLSIKRDLILKKPFKLEEISSSIVIKINLIPLNFHQLQFLFLKSVKTRLFHGLVTEKMSVMMQLRMPQPWLK